jgi:leucyl aminopeptidase
MKLTSKPAPANLPSTPLLAVLVCEGQRARLPKGVEVPKGFLTGFDGKRRTQASTWAVKGPAKRVLLLGLGSDGDVDAEELRRAGAAASQHARGEKVSKGTLWVHSKDLSLAGGSAEAGLALAEGLMMGSYQYTGGKGKAPEEVCKRLDLLGGNAAFRKGAKRGAHLAAANMYTRDLQNGAGNQVTPRVLVAEARKLAKRSARISVKIIDEKEMKRLGMGLLLSVSQGSSLPAYLIHLTYKPKAKKPKGRVCFVGKGLTFDAGGLSIKPSAKMDEMRYDMSGGAAVLGAFHALGDLDVAQEVHGLVPASENVINGVATKPGDIHRAMNGKTVEVNNTDAEGRLILADALCYAEKKIKPDTIIDLATLTGAVIVGLGHEHSAIYPTTHKLRDELLAAGEAVGEACWPLPLTDLHKDAMRGKLGDLTNISSPAVGAGSITGAGFLSHFVSPDTEWSHMDIAGTAWNTAARGWVGGALGSGVGARLLMDYLGRRK